MGCLVLSILARAAGRRGGKSCVSGKLCQEGDNDGSVAEAGLVFAWRRNRQRCDRGVDPLVTSFDQHYRDVVDNGILPTTANLLAHQPAIVSHLQATRIVPRTSGLPRYAMGAS